MITVKKKKNIWDFLIITEIRIILKILKKRMEEKKLNWEKWYD